MHSWAQLAVWRLWVLCLCLLMVACSTNSPPKQTEDLCAIFREKPSWYRDAKQASEEYQVSIPVNMAIMHQESRFQPKAKPPRRKILGFIPGPRLSSAYGFPQAKKETWSWYQDKTGRTWDDRDDFGDAIRFIGWYNRITLGREKTLRNDDAYHLYLAYHEGHGGFERRSFRDKQWLKNIAKKVSAQNIRYRQQLARCEKDLDDGGWFW